MTRPGATLANRYLIEETLGRGASGSVYRAKDTALGIPVVIKVLHEGLAQAHDVLERFKRELILARRVTHPGLCKVFDLQSEGETHFLVMEFIPGETLTTLLKREGKLAPERAIEILRQASGAIGAAHKEGVVHRDLKPENIMVRPNGQIAVLDFGIATQEGLDRLTRPGFVLGSRKYMAPELWTGHAPTPQSDVWSLGVILYGALCGRLPYRADGPFGVLDAIKTEERPKPSSLNPHVQPSLEAVIDRALAVEAGDRYPDAASFERALAQAVASSSDKTKVTKAPDFEALMSADARASASPAVIDLGQPLEPAKKSSVPAPLDDGGSSGGEPAHGNTSLDKPNMTWESWANDAPASQADGAGVPSVSALGAAFDAVLEPLPGEPPTDTKITPADAWRRADAALGTSRAFLDEGTGDRTMVTTAPTIDLSADDANSALDRTVEATDERNALTEDNGRPRVRRDDQPTVFVRNAPEDPLEVAAPSHEKTRTRLAAAALFVVVVVVVLAFSIAGGDDETKVAKSAAGTTQTSTTGAKKGEPSTPDEKKPLDVDEPVNVDGSPRVPKDVVPTDPPAPIDVAPSDTGSKKAGSDDPQKGNIETHALQGDTPHDTDLEGETGDGKVDDDKVDEKWDFDEPADVKPDATKAVRSSTSAEDARERARLKKVAETVEKAMAAKGLVRGDVRAIDAELSKARSAIRSKKWAAADASFERTRALVDTTVVDGALVAKKLARFNQRYDKVKDDAERAALGKLAVDIGKAMAKGDHATANAKLNLAMSSAH